MGEHWATADTPKGAVTAKVASKQLVASNRGRDGLYITNDGAKTVYVALGDTAAAHEGIRLNPEGGAVVLEGYSGPVSVITAEGESLVTFSEV